MTDRNRKGELRLRQTRHPLLYEVNTRVLLRELSDAAGKRITLAQVPDTLLDEWSSLGVDAVWLMGVWTTGKAGMEIARKEAELGEAYRAALPDVKEEDIIGSPYAVTAYTVARSLGGNAALHSLRGRLAERGMGLVLDFVCNHTARDHAWITKHPEYYLQGKLEEAAEKPWEFFRAKTTAGDKAIAFGRDPHFPGWTDTAQLNYFRPDARRALIDTLRKIADLCDGVRCDMAMLVLQDVFAETWKNHAPPPEVDSVEEEFWTEALAAVKETHPQFLFIAEAYWQREWQLQQLGFDYTYDKVLYDRLLREGAAAVYEHLKSERTFQQRMVRFIENHDELRAAKAWNSEPWHFAAAVIVATVPGMMLLHEGQLDGRTVKLPVQLGRRPDETAIPAVRSFYTRLLRVVSDPVFKNGEWHLLQARAAWHENHTWQNFLAFAWRGGRGNVKLVVVNYAPHNGQCYVELRIPDFERPTVEIRDLMSDSVYVRDRQGLMSRGMYFDLPPYGLHIFEVREAFKS